MATITKRKVAFSIVWDKDNPDDLTWVVKAWAVVSDDSEGGGEKSIRVTSPNQTITRAAFSTKDGDDIETLMINKSTEILQALGSGAGGHSIVDDLD